MLKLMSTEPRDALNRLVAALEYHFDAAQSGPGDSDAVDAAEERLCDAFIAYDDSLFTHFGVDLPFDLVDEDEDEDSGDEDDLGEGDEADDTELDEDLFDDSGDDSDDEGGEDSGDEDSEDSDGDEDDRGRRAF